MQLDLGFMTGVVSYLVLLAPGLGMLEVLASLVTARVLYQNNMLGWSAEGLSQILYFQLLFFCLHESVTEKFWHMYCVCCLLLVWPVYLPTHQL